MRYSHFAFVLVAAVLVSCETHSTNLVLCGFGLAPPAVRLQLENATFAPVMVRADDVFVAGPGSTAPLVTYSTYFAVPPDTMQSEYRVGCCPGTYALAVRRSGSAAWSMTVFVAASRECPNVPATLVVRARLD